MPNSATMHRLPRTPAEASRKRETPVYRITEAAR